MPLLFGGTALMCLAFGLGRGLAIMLCIGFFLYLLIVAPILIGVLFIIGVGIWLSDTDTPFPKTT